MVTFEVSLFRVSFFNIQSLDFLLIPGKKVIHAQHADDSNLFVFYGQRDGEIAQGKVPGVHFDKVKYDELSTDLLTDYRIKEKKAFFEQSEAQITLNAK